MKLKIFSCGIATLAIAITFTNCSKKGSTVPTPIADFTISAVGNNTHSPATMNFTNTSLYGTIYLWTFGDNTISTNDNAYHLYNNAGTYTVTLTATAGSKSNSRTQNVTIQQPYTKVTINKVTLNSTSETTSFTGYIRLTDASGNELWKSVNVTINPASLPTSWTLGNPVTFSNLSTYYYVEIWKVGTLTNTRIAVSPFAPSLISIGTSDITSYPINTDGSNGLSFGLVWQ